MTTYDFKIKKLNKTINLPVRFKLTIIKNKNISKVLILKEWEMRYLIETLDNSI